MLAVARLIFHLVQKFGPIDTNIAHHMDNQGVITSMKEMQERVKEVPQNCFKAKWDILIEVKNTMKMLGVQLNTKHEKGHQDSKTKHKDLPLLRQLNVDADKLATQALDEASIEKCSPIMPNTKCHLIIQGRTITSKMKTELRKAYALCSSNLLLFFH